MKGSTPVCMEGCPAIQLARNGIVPPVVHVRMCCSSGRRKLVTVTSMILDEAQADGALLVHLFHEEADEARTRRVASTLYSVLRERKRGILKKCVNSQAVYPLSEQDGLKARERRYTAHEEGKHWE